jgi:hypothetical protein
MGSSRSLAEVKVGWDEHIRIRFAYAQCEEAALSPTRTRFRLEKIDRSIGSPCNVTLRSTCMLEPSMRRNMSDAPPFPPTMSVLVSISASPRFRERQHEAFDAQAP